MVYRNGSFAQGLRSFETAPKMHSGSINRYHYNSALIPGSCFRSKPKCSTT